MKCTFGILKMRFRILRNAVLSRKEETVDNIMTTCCILHNMILTFDRKDITAWESNVDWESLDPNPEEEDLAGAGAQTTTTGPEASPEEEGVSSLVCEIHINTRTKKIILVAKKNIEPNEEILFNYGSGFWH